MGISSPGIGSNLDVSSIVSQLIAVDKQPLAALDLKTASFQAKLSGFGTLKGVLSQFQTALSGLSDISKFQAVKASAADASIATAIGSSVAVPGSYSLEVSKLAQAQKLNAAGQVSSTAAIGSGAATVLSFDFGTIASATPDPVTGKPVAATADPVTGKYSNATFTSGGTGAKTVTIDATNNSLSGIRDAINKAAVGVTATIVNDGSGTPFRLALSVNATGETNSLKISVAGDAALSTLLANDPAGSQALSQTAPAQNAAFKVDGIAISKPDNKVADVIPGVTLTLAKTNVGTPTAINVSRDTASVVSSVNAFVEAFNTTTKTLRDASAYDPVTKKAAVLNGEASVRSIQNQIRGVLAAPVAGGASTLTLLSQVGVSIQKDGTLGVDGAKLQKAVDTNFSEIAGLFSAAGKSADSLVAYTGASPKTAAGAYAVDISQLATRGNTTAGAAITAPLTITAGVNDMLQVKLNGVSASITLGADTYSAATLAAEIQSKINGNAAFIGVGATAAVTQAGGVLSIASTAYGAISGAEITGGSARADLMFDTGATVTAGLNVEGKINGATAVGSGQSLVGAVGNAAEGLNLLINGGALGSRGSVNYSLGYAFQLKQLTTSLIGTEGPIASRTTGLSASLKDVAKSKAALNARLVTKEKQYRAQFSALDGVISKMSTTSTFLTQQLANLSKNS